MTELEQIKQIAEQGCQCPCSDCILNDICGREPEELAQGILDLISYDSDLSKSKVGDWVWTVQSEWLQIEEIKDNEIYSIVLSNDESCIYDGKYMDSDEKPTTFIEPPLCFNPKPKPESKPEPVSPFLKGDRVIVYNKPKDEICKRYFAEYFPESAFPYSCFVVGGDEWSSDGETARWKCCEAYEGEN